jgi:hypothetical protein
VFLPDPAVRDWRGEPGCVACPMPRSHPVHEVPPTSAEVDRVDARRLGEAEENE